MKESLYTSNESSTEIIKALRLSPHPEGGHFAVTYVSDESVKSPFAGADRTTQSTIYYLLSLEHDEPDNHLSGPEKLQDHRSAIGYMHKNKSETMHVHHWGRSVYTLISTDQPPQIRQVVMGADASRGEVRQLMVRGNEWKVSEIPREDRDASLKGLTHAEHVGALISEVVTPGFDWHDHEYLTLDKLQELFKGDSTSVERFKQYIRKD